MSETEAAYSAAFDAWRVRNVTADRWFPRLRSGSIDDAVADTVRPGRLNAGVVPSRVGSTDIGDVFDVFDFVRQQTLRFIPVADDGR